MSESSDSEPERVHDKFFDRPEFSSEESVRRKEEERHERQRRQQERPRESDSGFELLRRSLRGCCIPFNFGPSPPQAVPQARPNGNPLMATSFVEDEESETSSEEEAERPEKRKEENVQARSIAKECGLDWTALPNVFNVEKRAHSTVSVQLIPTLQDGFTELTEDQRSAVALHWILSVVRGARMHQGGLRALLTTARDYSSKLTVQQAIRNTPELQSVELEAERDVSTLDGVGGEYRRLLEQFANRGLFLIIAKHRVVATYTGLRGELAQNAVFDVGCTQTRGPGIFLFESWEDAEALIFALFKYDGVARLQTRPFKVYRIIDPHADLQTDDLPIAPAVEPPVEPGIGENEGEADNPYRGFEQAYGAMHKAVAPGVEPNEKEYATDPKTQQLVTNEKARKRKKRK